MVVSSCQSWLCPYETGFSGPATLSISLPSGSVDGDYVDFYDEEDNGYMISTL